jgi:hypothetical protein
MKSAAAFFLMMAWAILVPGRCLADPATPAATPAAPRHADSNHATSPDAGDKPGNKNANGQRTSGNETPDKSTAPHNATSTNPPKPSAREQVAHQPESTPAQPSPGEPPPAHANAAAPKTGAVPVPSAIHNLTPHPAGNLPSAGPTLSDMRHRGSNPPIIGGVSNGGLTRQHISTTGAINGTGATHRH